MAAASVDTENSIWQFIHAYEGDYVNRDGRVVIDDPEVRRKLIKAIDSYTAVYRKGCTPPDSVTWEAYQPCLSYAPMSTAAPTTRGNPSRSSSGTP